MTSDSNSQFLEEMNRVSEYHYERSSEYRILVDLLFKGEFKTNEIESLPFIPVTLFKEFDLKSTSADKIFLTLQSSGTTGQTSKIFISKENAKSQKLALGELFRDRLGSARMPMVIFENEAILERDSVANARKAAVIGFSSFTSKRFFALDRHDRLDFHGLRSFLESHGDSKVVFFGFTSEIWKTLLSPSQGNRLLNFPRGVLLHGGGWKKLEDLKISKVLFKKSVLEVMGISEVVDYYGMAEQSGSIFFECTSSFFHTSKYSSVIARDFSTFLPLPNGKQGLIQVLSILPSSYPGHSILTQDIGNVIGVDDCECGQNGKYFTILGRLPKSQVRGCSDV